MASFLEILGLEIAQMLRIYLFIMEIILRPVREIAQGSSESTEDDGDTVGLDRMNEDCKNGNCKNVDSSGSNSLSIKDGKKDEELGTPTPQFAASIEFFATPELCERPLRLLSLVDNLHARQASLALRDTIRASPFLQRRLFLLPGAIPHDPNDLLISNPILILNPFVFAAKVGMVPGKYKLFLTPFLLNYIDSYKTATLGSLGDMFITQPPRISLEVQYAWTKPGFGEDQTVMGKSALQNREGIKVKDLMRFVVEIKWGGPEAQIYQEWDRAEGEIAVVVRGAWEISRERI
ncbi:hypothetical protein TI39_contig4111g00017 [Zymoseptoria brevis]|uniref:Uncharacterized protein n=1 Tax=Zymoseptoria brevis TaxID=1047168 RepID=A0A0F4GH08_9PEZI|nr:hypothetical protein TI39_contig4111g00017 [Zymoseptoria brevis]